MDSTDPNPECTDFGNDADFNLKSIKDRHEIAGGVLHLLIQCSTERPRPREVRGAEKQRGECERLPNEPTLQARVQPITI
jgi:hypothetical protein